MSPALTARFWAKVDIPTLDGCWLWTGATNSTGYPCFGVMQRSQLAHRLSYEAHVGPIGDGLTIDHLCRTKRCVNPAHLEVTRAENARRGAAATRPTHCPRGHEYTPENTYTKRRPGGQLNHECRECRRIAQVKRRATRGRPDSVAGYRTPTAA